MKRLLPFLVLTSAMEGSRMKSEYKTPELEMLELSVEDIVTASGIDSENNGTEIIWD